MSEETDKVVRISAPKGKPAVANAVYVLQEYDAFEVVYQMDGHEQCEIIFARDAAEARRRLEAITQTGRIDRKLDV